MKLCVDVDYSFSKGFFNGEYICSILCVFCFTFYKMYRFEYKIVCVSHVLCFYALKYLCVLCLEIFREWKL